MIEELTARRLVLLRAASRWGASRCRSAIAAREELAKVTLELLKAIYA